MIDMTQASLVLTGLSLLVGMVVFGTGLAFGWLTHRTFPPEVQEVPVSEGARERPVDPALLARRSAAYRLGGLVLIGLAVLTGVEYAIGLFLSSLVLLFIMGLFKAGLILQYFMHVASLWSEEGHS